MGRPLSGSKRQTTTGWEVSVPIRRGDRRRVTRTMGTEADADAWIAAQLELLNGGADADSNLVAGAATVAPGPVADVGFADVAWAWHQERYVLQHQGDGERQQGIADDLRLHLIPAFADLLDLDRADARRHVIGWVRTMAGYETDVELPHSPARSYARRTVTGLLWVLTEVLAHAEHLGVDVPMKTTKKGTVPAATAGVTAMARRGQPRRAAKLVTLADTARIASGMHVIHQSVLWLLRVAGLRISEAYGLTVGNFVDDGTWGFLLIEAQGGRRFITRDDDENIVTTNRKASVKTAAGYRLIALPHHLTALLRTVVDAFHTDPETGEVDATARLIPTIRSTVGGAHGFRAALKTAVAGDDVDERDLVIAHELRKGYATDLAWSADLDGLVKRRAMGHRAGDDVFAAVYTLDGRLKESMKPAAALIDDEITATIGTLLVPTGMRPAYGTDRCRNRTRHADAVLAAAGWLIDTGADGWIGTVEAAEILGLTPQTTRRLFDSEIPAARADDGTWTVRLDDVTAWRERNDGKRRIGDVADELGRSYHHVHRTIGRLGLSPAVDAHSRAVLLDDADVASLRAEYERLDQLGERSVTVAEACRLLRVRHSTISGWLASGRLETDDETDAAGLTFVTRGSVEAELAARHPRWR